MKAANIDSDLIFIPSRRHTFKPVMADPNDEPPDLKTYSAGTAAKVTFSRDRELQYSSVDLGGDPSDPSTDRKQKQKRLLKMKARGFANDESSRCMQQEDLQEWLDNLHLKLHEARHSSSTTSNERRTNPVVSNEPEEAPKNVAGQKRRSRSMTAISSTPVAIPDSGAALTDSNYLDNLQKSLRQASISSLQDRLIERQLKEERTATYSPLSVSVRPKVLDRAAATKPRPKKTSKSGIADGRESVSSVSSQGSDAATKTCSLPTKKQTTPAVRQRSSTTAKLFDTNQQKVDDLYRVAEKLILPPARPDVPAEGQRSAPDSPVFEPLADDVPLEDYWDVKEII